MRALGRVLARGPRSRLAISVIATLHSLLGLSNSSPVSQIYKVSLLEKNERQEKERRKHLTHVGVIAKSLERSKKAAIF